MKRKNTHKYQQEDFDEEQLNESFHTDLLETCPIHRVQSHMI